MAERTEKVTKVVEAAPAEPAATEVREVSEARAGGSTLAARIIWYIAGVLLVLLAFRFVLALLGANPNNGFADFIYSASHPFVAPFFGLFGYTNQIGVSKFEIYTLIAMAVYAVVAWGLAKLVTIDHPE
jgi:cation transport ATPase